MKQKIYFVGIKGVGMTSLALIAKEAGFEISGSDVEDEFITDLTLKQNGISLYEGFGEENCKDFFGSTDPSKILVITTAAHGGLDNPEVRFAKSAGIDVWTHGQAVGQFMDGAVFQRSFKGISVAGSHGKTTITALLATVLTDLGSDPSYTVGTSEIFPLTNSGHYGSGDFFVAEADEYASDIIHDRKAKLLYQHPYYAIVNNIDFDHPDFYSSVDEVTGVFRTFLNENIQKGGSVFVNGDDPQLKNSIQDLNRWCTTYGKEDGNVYVYKNFQTTEEQTYFDVFREGDFIGNFSLLIPGEHNAFNSLPVIALCQELGYKLDDIREALLAFKGTKRRFERVGITPNESIIIDDYAHHPGEIKATLTAAKSFFPKKKITVIFQPHTFSRTTSLLPEFVKSLEVADEVILLPIFASQREKGNSEQSRKIIEKMTNNSDKIHAMESVSDVVEYIHNPSYSYSNVIITMGAGDVYKIAYELKK